MSETGLAFEIGTIELEPIDPPPQPVQVGRWYDRASLKLWLSSHRWYALIVVLPSLCAILYYGLLAANRYEAEARFVVRSPSSAAASQITSLVQGTGIVRSADDSYIVQAYVRSRDAVRRLVAEADLLARLQRPEADFWWRYPGWFGWTSDEHLWRHFQNFVGVDFDSTTGITTLKVQAFRPDDARDIAEALLSDSETLINSMSGRSQRETIRTAELEVDASRARARETLDHISAFRRRNSMIDPGRVSAAAMETITRLALEIARTNAELGELRLMAGDSPQAKSLVQRIAAYEDQIRKERATLAGTDTSLAPLIAEYERLVLERSFAERTFASAQSALEIARLDGERQRLFVERISAPARADYPKYPYRLLSILGVFLVASMLYSIGSRLASDTRSHAGN